MYKQKQVIVMYNKCDHDEYIKKKQRQSRMKIQNKAARKHFNVMSAAGQLRTKLYRAHS